MHDWTLLSILVYWRSRLVELKFRDLSSQEIVVGVEGLLELHVPRRDEWGPSVSVNNVTGPARLPNGNQRLIIQMQSGDSIDIEASAFKMPSINR
jgi:hypothetical protein